jgi:hypothetical protein
MILRVAFWSHASLYIPFRVLHFTHRYFLKFTIPKFSGSLVK